MDKPNLQLACRNLEQGKVIAYPSEAVWGLGCDPYNKDAVNRILSMKNRPREKGLILVAASSKQFDLLLQGLSAEQQETLRSSWPGHTTWLIPDPDQLIPDWIKGSHQSVAVRVSAHPVIQQLCLLFGAAIVSTSANKTGEAEIRSRLLLEDKFVGSIDCIVAGELGQAEKPSEMRDIISGKVIR